MYPIVFTIFINKMMTIRLCIIDDITSNHILHKISPPFFFFLTISHSRQIAKKILKGEETGAKADAVLLNAGVGIYLMQEGITIAEGIQIAKNTIESGKAYAKLEEFIALTNEA